MTLVLYTCFYGSIEPPNHTVFGPAAEHYRRVVFTDNPALDFPGVEIYVDPLAGLDPARASRRAKMLPHRYFPEAEWSLYIDNKSRLHMDPAEVLAAAQKQEASDFYAFAHFARDCVYKEGQTIWENGLDDVRIVRQRLDYYRDLGIPERSGLIEGSFLLRRHNAPEIQYFGERWFEQVLAYSRRDQLSFPYLVWLLKQHYVPITALPQPEVYQVSVYDPKKRKRQYRRRNLAYQQLRSLYHMLRRRPG